ncbi:MAG: mechanosensitive ion channel family protein [Pseudomonadota bacterium]|nr:MAG: mechanosensitive ion channel family protein [Pseudomonadota bacterium]
MAHVLNASLRRLTLLLLIVIVCLAGRDVGAQEKGEKQAPQPAEITKVLDSTERELKREPARLGKLNEYLKQLPNFRSWATKCIADTEKALAQTEEGFKSLGDPVKGETAAVVKKRAALEKEKAAAEKALATCRVIELRSAEFIDEINALKQSILAEQLLAKGPNLFVLLRENWQQPAIWIDASKEFIVEHSGLDKLTQVQWLMFVLVLALSAGASMVVRTALRNWEQHHEPGDVLSRQLLCALVTTFRHYAPSLLTSAAAALFLHFATSAFKPTPFLTLFAYGLPAVFVSMALIHLFLYTPLNLRGLRKISSDAGRALARRLKVLVLLIFIGYILFATILSQSLPEPALLVARAVYAAVLVLNLIWVIWLAGRLHGATRSLVIRILISALLLGMLSAEFLGYRNLSGYMLRTILGTLIALGLFALLSDLVSDAFDSLERGELRWQKKLRDKLGAKPGEHLPGVVWVRLLLSTALWVGLVVALIFVWQVPTAYVDIAAHYLLDGFKVGTVHIDPLRIVEAVLILALLLALNGWIRRRFEKKWLAKTRMDRGARESVATITGYVGVTIVLLIALSVAGMDFSNLAIIAGALSLGIGFGLQNIVNNFVSGLILLFERPVKTGDWIVVGGVEGYVKRISIRSTQIQTFDRADVIVPNSELVSGQVTNWMLHDMRGRVRVPVGVAYGSDTAAVKDVLLSVANEHPDVITDGILAPPPRVLFVRFGDSSLDFELRAHVRDVDRRMVVISDLNFAIDATFREKNIEIPFPQRDLHVKNLPGKHAPAPEQAPLEEVPHEDRNTKERDGGDT